MILELHRQGVSVSAIARRVSLDRKTVRRYIAQGLEPPAYGPRQPRISQLRAFEPYLRQRLGAFPQLTGRRLPRDICGTALRSRAFADISSGGNGAVICPASFGRGLGPLASMKSAMRGADQSNALVAHSRAGLSRLGISSRGVIVCLLHLALCPALTPVSPLCWVFGSRACHASCHSRFPICPALGEKSPYNPRHLVGERDGDDLDGTARQQGDEPSGSVIVVPGVAQDRRGPEDQQGAERRVAHF